MREHQIPQDVTGYQFHIVGNMTLKQFGLVAGGVVLGFIIYKLGFPNYIGVPIALLVAATGAAAAFVPFEERPLDHWIITFFRVLNKPTQFYWKKVEFIPPVFAYHNPDHVDNPEPEADLNPARRARIKQYISSLNYETPQVDQVSALEIDRINSILQTFDSLPTGQGVLQIQKPSLKLKPRRIRKLSIQPTPEPIIGEQIADDKFMSANSSPNPNPTSNPNSSANNEGASASSTLSNNDEGAFENTNTNTNTNTNINTNNDNIFTTPLSSQQSEDLLFTNPTAPTNDQIIQTSQVAFNKDLPIPDPPTQPNKLVGMVMTPNQDLLSGVIVEVVTPSSGQIARAVKTNALGQFFISTPLPAGEYILRAEHATHQFEPISIALNNQVVAPIEIISV